MQIETIALDKIQTAPYNPRADLKPGDAAYERLKRSIEEFDLVEPLVWNRRTGHLVGGHQRLKVLKSRGLTHVEVSVVDLPPEREKALNVALNNPNLAGDWDLSKLNELIAELGALPEFDETLTGFDASEIRALVLEASHDLNDDVAEDESETETVEVRLVVPADGWERVKPDLDALVARHDLECHVRPADGQRRARR
jgi:ParB-like chromosome segregation protein Spo0J